MRRATRCLSAATLLLGLTAVARAETFSTTAVFTFAPAPGPDVVADANKDLKAKEDITVRPNQPAEFFLYAYNPDEVDRTFTVDARGGPGSKFAAQAKVTIPAKQWKRVRLQKPAPPAPPPAVTPPAAPPAAAGAEKAPEPLPPGDALNLTRNGFVFTVRLLDEKGNLVTDAGKAPYGRDVAVRVQRPSGYVEVAKATHNQTGAFSELLFTVQPKKNADGEAVFTGPAPVDLSFPPQPALAGAIVREGIYRRTLVVEPGAKVLPAATLAGAIEKAGPGLLVGVGVDGYERAFTYRPDTTVETKTPATLTPDDTPRVRVFPGTWPKVPRAVRPLPAFPVRIETDNDTPDSTLQLWVQPAGSTDATQRELQRLPGTRDERAWADAAGPLDGGVLVSNRLRDWVRPVDLSALRGNVEVVAVLTVPGKAEAEARFPLRIDDTAPRFVEFGDIEPRRLVKGSPVGVSATAEDRESDIVRAYFFVGRPLDDGSPPPDAPKFEAALIPAKGPFQWTATAQIPVPADKKGDMIVGVVFVNDAGIATVRTQRIEIVDAALAVIRTGTVVGRVTLGERPQPGLIVTLTDTEGKVKGTATTDDAGRFRFEKVIPGNYNLASAKKDSSYGSAGSTPVDVKSDPEVDPKAKPKPDDRPQANVSLSLTRRPR